MQKSVQMTVFFSTLILQRKTILCFIALQQLQQMRYRTSGCLSSHGVLLGVLSSNCSIFQSTRRSPMREQRGAITALYLVTQDIEILGVVNKSIYLLLF